MQKFRIKIGTKTKEHNVVLAKLGFDVKIEDGHYVFEANALSLKGEVDISNDEAIKTFAKHCRDNKEVADYSTKFLVTKKDGTKTVMSSILACTALGTTFSALVAKPYKAPKAKGPAISDLD